MKRIIAAILWCSLPFFIKAQPNLLGTWPVCSPLSFINFYDNDSIGIDTTGKWQPYHHFFTDAVMSNDINQLRFFTNGALIANMADEIISGGDSLIDDRFYHDYGPTGLSSSQGVLALPRTENTWWVFNYSFSDSAYGNPNVLSPDRLYGAILDMNANGGQGGGCSKRKYRFTRG
ncbi:MAG: hypothetical protein NTY88_06040 [Bacteroidetes bacterium]|nr:hypothetical protein [Bacteroidota bacterium]